MQSKFKLNVQLVVEAVLLLAMLFGILAYFTHQTLRREAVRDAEQTLEGTMLSIDNILLGVEQATCKIYDDLLGHLDDPDRMFAYSRSLVESNANIVGCAICFKPGYYPGKDLFMAYIHRKSSAPEDRSTLVTAETFTDRPYTEQVWYAEPMNTGHVGWIDPLKGSATETEPLVTFCLPFSDKSGERIGVIAVDMSIQQLSQIILSSKPSENGYGVLLGQNGSYIVHPDKRKLTDPNIYSQKNRNVDPTEIEAARAMVAGESGMKKFRRDDGDWYVFYQPFKRVGWDGKAHGSMNWSVGVVSPEDDIFGMHNILLWQVFIIAVGGILLFFVLCSWIIRRQLKPMRRLADSARHIAEGNYNEMLPFTQRRDEIGLLQERFKNMQRSLQKQVDDLKEETQRLSQYGGELRSARDKTIEIDAVKTSILHYMADQISAHAENIDKSTTKLCNGYQNLGRKEIIQQVDTIQRNSHALVGLLRIVGRYTENGIKKGGQS